MSKKKQLEPRSGKEFIEAKKELRATIKKMGFKNPDTWTHIHEAACDLRKWMKDERPKVKAINTRKKELAALRGRAQRLRESLAGLDHYHSTQIDYALRVSYRAFAGDYGAPGLDELTAALDALKTASDDLWGSLEKRLEGDGDHSKPPSEFQRIKFILWRVCLHLSRYEKPARIKEVIEAIFQAAAHLPDGDSSIPGRHAKHFAEWANTPAGARAIAARQGIYKDITAEK